VLESTVFDATADLMASFFPNSSSSLKDLTLGSAIGKPHMGL